MALLLPPGIGVWCGEAHAGGGPLRWAAGAMGCPSLTPAVTLPCTNPPPAMQSYFKATHTKVMTACNAAEKAGQVCGVYMEQ